MQFINKKSEMNFLELKNKIQFIKLLSNINNEKGADLLKNKLDDLEFFCFKKIAR